MYALFGHSNWIDLHSFSCRNTWDATTCLADPSRSIQRAGLMPPILNLLTPLCTTDQPRPLVTTPRHPVMHLDLDTPRRHQAQSTP